VIADSDVVVATTAALADLSTEGRASVDLVVADDLAAAAEAARVMGRLVDRGIDGERVRFGKADDDSPRAEPAPLDPAPDELMRDPVGVIDYLVDGGSFVPFERSEPSGLHTGLALVGGWPVVVAATGGEESAILSIPDLGRLRRAWRLSGRLCMPLLLVQDCAGYGADAEGDLEAVGALVGEIRRAGSPAVTVVTGKGHTLGTFPLGTRQLGAAYLVAWPWAQLSATDTVSYEAAHLDAAREATPWLAAGRGLLDDVLSPVETVHAVRQMVALFGEHWQKAEPQERPNDGPDSGIG
jgi:acetyl-CoA carboxylase carboxyltransferase component